MNPKTLCDQNTKEQLAERVVDLEDEIIDWKAVADKHLSRAWKAENASAQFESENADLKKYLKHARDDKAIRLGEIAEHEHTIMVLRHLGTSFVDVKDDLQKLARDRSIEIAELREELQQITDGLWTQREIDAAKWRGREIAKALEDGNE